MTRDEAKQFKWFMSDREEIYKHIDKIYDAFEEMVCVNCKHLSPTGVCMNKKSFCYNMSMVDNEQIAYFSGIPKEEFDRFGCNKFLKK